MKKKTIDKLKQITDSIPKELKDSLMKKRLTMPVAKELLERAMDEDSISDEKKSTYKNLLNSGYLNQTEDYYDEDIARQIDAYVEQKIVEAVNNKELPKSNFIGLIKKLKQQAKHEIKQRN